MVKALQEGLGGIRDVLLDGSQPVYCEVYGEADQRLRRAQGVNVFIGQSPRYAMESLGMVMIAALAYGSEPPAWRHRAALPVLGALALGAQRMLPACSRRLLPGRASRESGPCWRTRWICWISPCLWSSCSRRPRR